ncbi:class I SAM-dependent rRNA methyltransferase [Deinococcus fonticola]|uniref:class I SAM-dependent rRNA methyltransferase n=1 Tax=Deinococcus fonticola TaxID=2528713 RepID=UPI001074DD2C|nr:class I SAM-dependent methyltransferase [Deinococcus fonticola]
MFPDLPRLFARRAHLPEEGATVYRAAHLTETNGLFALDVAGSVGVLSLYGLLTGEQEKELAHACAEAGDFSGVYLKRRPVEAKHAANTQRDYLSPPDPLWGEATPEITALENGVPFLIRPGADLSIGLFTDARPARQWVRQATPASVLNTFAYTCGFGLNAALGGAQAVKNIDLSRKVLAWGQENYALSGLPAPDTDFLYGDVFEWLRRLHKRGEQYALVILDPPSFARSQAGTWRAEKDYARLAAQAAAVTAPGGQILALLNHAGVSPTAFERMFHRGMDNAHRSGRVVERLHPGEDYPQATHLKVHVWQLNG